MNKGKKPSSEKQFMQTMIITGVVGLAVMVIVTLYMIKLFGGEKTKAKVVEDPLIPITEDQMAGDIVGEEMRALIYDVGFKGKNIKAWDLGEDKLIKLYIKDKTKLQNEYGKLMSIQEVQLGEIVDIIYEGKTKNILKLEKSPKAWRKSGVIGTEVDTDSKTIKLDNRKYQYTDTMIVMDDQLKLMDLGEIKKLDTLTIKGIGDTIWSIQVERPAGYLKLLNLKNRQGTIEIGNNQRYQLNDIEDHIALPAGDHKVVIRMEGYEPFAGQVTISLNQVEEIDLSDVKELRSELTVKVINTNTDYKVQINNKTYKKGEEIIIKPGEHTLKVMAEGFQTAEVDIEVREGRQNINIRLEAEVDPEEENPDPEKPNNVQANNEKPSNTKPSQEKPSLEKPRQNESTPIEEEVEIRTVQIIIETDPTGAEVFVSGVSKGITPALTGLKPGEYSITIQKEGYSPLYSTIIIDASNAQKGFLYTLQEE